MTVEASVFRSKQAGALAVYLPSHLMTTFLGLKHGEEPKMTKP
jgi:hypothetical protein